LEETEQSQRYALNLEFKLNCFFQKVIKDLEGSNDELKNLKLLLKRIENSRVYYEVTQVSRSEFICLRKFTKNLEQVDQFKITF